MPEDASWRVLRHTTLFWVRGGDHDGTPWRTEVSTGLAGVVVLVAVFQAIKVAVG